VVEEVRAEREFELRVVDVEGDPELEARYREWLPVVEIDGERAFVYHVQAADLARRLERSGETPTGRPVGSDGCAGEARTS
jgi:Glutaredoxin-like domain (DUF836)